MLTPYYTDEQVTVHHGDCLEVLRGLPDCSVDAVVTDPPYGISFMGQAWDQPDSGHGSQRKNGKPGPHLRRPGVGDHKKTTARDGAMEAGRYDLSPHAMLNFQRWCTEWAAECLRVLKPGGHMLAFGGSRTWHRLACAVEDAGFEIRDSIAWIYGSGFSKGGLLGNKAGLEWCECGPNALPEALPGPHEPLDDGARRGRVGCPRCGGLDPAFRGFSTTLKPAFEPVVVARKPLTGSTVAANVLAHGTGALNIDGCRVHGEDAPEGRLRHGGGSAVSASMSGPLNPDVRPASPAGRWPANVVLDESQAAALDEQSGTLTSGILSSHHKRAPKDAGILGAYGSAEGERGFGDSGGASRFFFIAREDNDPCHSTSGVNTAGTPSSRQSERDGSAPSGAATTACPDGGRPTGSPSTPATPSGSRPSDESGTPLTTTTGSESSLDSPRAKPSQMVSRARYAESLRPTDTTTTTTSHSTSDGFADLTTSSSTPPSAPGVPLDELGSRFTYVAKANSAERPKVDGVAHPTVKPLDLMRWLVRLVTPPGGVVLDPFAGSGTTAEACVIEGFRCVLIEREAGYLPLIVSRLTKPLEPVLDFTRETTA